MLERKLRQNPAFHIEADVDEHRRDLALLVEPQLGKEHCFVRSVRVDATASCCSDGIAEIP